MLSQILPANYEQSHIGSSRRQSSLAALRNVAGWQNRAHITEKTWIGEVFTKALTQFLSDFNNDLTADEEHVVDCKTSGHTSEMNTFTLTTAN